MYTAVMFIFHNLNKTTYLMACGVIANLMQRVMKKYLQLC